MNRPAQSADLIPVLTSDEMRGWERRCFAEGLSERVVMESAGRAAAAVVAKEFPEGTVIAAVGRGNNGGDALIALRTLRAWGREVAAVYIGGDPRATDLAHGWNIPTADDGTNSFARAGVVIDGILGTGASGAPREAESLAIRSMNGAGRPIVALDGPSGVDLSTGQTAGEAIHAALTVTFGALKLGLIRHPGRGLAGRILLAEVGFPPLGQGDGLSCRLITDQWAKARLPRADADAHKYQVGIVAVVAGRTGFGGAAIMTSMGALRAGCGGVRVLSTDSNRVAIQTAVPEAVFIDRDAEDASEALSGTRALVAGPGIGTDAAAARVLQTLMTRFAGPMVLDADALTLLSSRRISLPEQARPDCVLTPHPGELARLLGEETATILADPIGSARAAAGRFGCVVLAKGTPSFIAAPEGPVLISVSGHPGVATGGMGDTLAGIVATFLAGGATPTEAAAMGVHFAGRAAETAGRGRGLLPRDVAEAIPEVLESVAEPVHVTDAIVFELPPPS